MLPLRVSTMVRCSTDMMATGHNTDRHIVAVLGGPLRGRKAARIQSPRPVRVESAAVTSAPYTGRPPTMRPPGGRGGGTSRLRGRGGQSGNRAGKSGGTVGVGSGQLAAVEVADQRRDRAGRIDAGAVAD